MRPAGGLDGAPRFAAPAEAGAAFFWAVAARELSDEPLALGLFWVVAAFLACWSEVLDGRSVAGLAVDPAGLPAAAEAVLFAAGLRSGAFSEAACLAAALLPAAFLSACSPAAAFLSVALLAVALLAVAPLAVALLAVAPLAVALLAAAVLTPARPGASDERDTPEPPVFAVRAAGLASATDARGAWPGGVAPELLGAWAAFVPWAGREVTAADAAAFFAGAAPWASPWAFALLEAVDFVATEWVVAMGSRLSSPRQRVLDDNAAEGGKRAWARELHSSVRYRGRSTYARGMPETAGGRPDEDRDAPYPEVAAQARYPALEEGILAYWRDDKTFEASVELHSPETEFVFYDGPPFANGLPHYGHLLTGFVKDAVPRYQTMRGHRVERRFGWDCHGLPAEVEAEKELGVHGRQGVTAFGIDRFNDRCRQIVQRTTDAWERYVTRQARWVDFENDYKTMDLSFMESVIWAFRQLYDKGLAYEGYRVLPYCWICETPLSNFETRQDDSYRDRTDPAVTVLFDLLPVAAPDGAATDDAAAVIAGPLRLMAWTTTPWTLPSNLALAVGPDIDYVVLRRATAAGPEYLVVGADRAEAYEAELALTEEVGRLKGSQLVGRTYRPLFPYFSGAANAFRVLEGDFVTTEDGTGVVHMAPGFGEDDQRACQAAGIEVVCPVDDAGRFTAEVADFAGLQVFDANAPIVERLDANGVLVRAEEYTHSYPHCWRTDTPLIYRAVSSWFIQVTAVKDRMVELNRQISWMPEHVRDGAFGKWLEGARDWSISRNRFWGTPIPVWKSDDPAYPRIDVYGSLDELEADFGVRPTDLHRPSIDELTRPNPDDPTGRSKMRRISDVLDCWFDSGAMPFAQLHYPFENRQRFEDHFPADFIVEYVSQTRGWFYTLHVLGTALFDRPPFRSCIAHGVVLGHDGRKLSKRLRNFPDPEAVFAEQGADAMRWYLLSSPVLRGLDVVIEAKALAEPVRLVENPIWNTWYFLSLYSNADGVRGRVRTDQDGVLDRYVLAKGRQLIEQVTGAMEGYDLAGATSAITSFLDALTNWYVRRSRDRFWRASPDHGAGETDKQDAYDTLHTVLDVLCRVAAPFLPFLTEAVYRGLTGERSVHLAAWPAPAELPADPDLVEAMDLVRDVCSAGHSIRKATGLRARLPLRSVTIASGQADRLGPFVDLIADELNVKDVRLSGDVAGVAERVLAIVPAVLGPRLGADTQKVIGAARRGEWTATPEGVTVAGHDLRQGEYVLRLQPADESTSRVLASGTGIVSLDIVPDDDLADEGAARDLVRMIQQERRSAGLSVSDRIHLDVVVEHGGRPLGSWRSYVMAQTLASELEVTESESQGPDQAPTGALADGRRIWISLRRA